MMTNEEKRERNRREFPGVTSIVDQFTVVFGSVKVLHATENGKEIGKAPTFDGLDVDQLLRLDNWRSNRK